MFKLSPSEIEYFSFNYFNFIFNNNITNISFQQLLAVMLSIYFLEILFHKEFKSKDSTNWVTKKISLDNFIKMIMEGCFFLRHKPLVADLEFIFKALDTDKDKFITFQQYSDFIKKYLGNNIDLHQKEDPNAGKNGKGGVNGNGSGSNTGNNAGNNGGNNAGSGVSTV